MVQVLTNQEICSTTDRVHGSNLGPSRMAIVARGHPLLPGAEQADARTCRCLSARLGGVPKAGPPHVMAGMRPVLMSTVALRLREASHLTWELRPLAEDSRLRAWVASRRVPQLTGVPKSTTGTLALTTVPRSASCLTALLARALSLLRTTVLAVLGVGGRGRR